jgi:uncharacterized protein
MVERVGPARHLVGHADLRLRAAAGGHADRVRSAVGGARARAQVRADGLSEHPLYAWLSSVGLLLLGYIIAAGSIETWTVVRYIGARGMPAEANAWRDAVFGLPLRFYLFDLPFYSDLRGYLLALIIVSGAGLLDRGARLAVALPAAGATGHAPDRSFDLPPGRRPREPLSARRAVVFLLALALRFFLARYEMVYDDHGFMVGIDYVDLHFALPLQWLVIVCCVAAAALVWMRRWIMAAFMALSLVVLFAVPRLVNSLYVRPNEISIQRPFIDTHIHATRSGLWAGAAHDRNRVQGASGRRHRYGGAQGHARQRAPVGHGRVP